MRARPRAPGVHFLPLCVADSASTRQIQARVCLPELRLALRGGALLQVGRNRACSLPQLVLLLLVLGET